MPYTQEQIDRALSHIRNCYVIVGKCEQKPYKVKNSTYGDMIYSSGGECTIDLKADIGIILAALKDEQHMTDKAMEQYDKELEKNYNLEACLEKLEKSSSVLDGVQQRVKDEHLS